MINKNYSNAPFTLTQSMFFGCSSDSQYAVAAYWLSCSGGHHNYCLTETEDGARTAMLMFDTCSTTGVIPEQLDSAWSAIQIPESIQHLFYRAVQTKHSYTIIGNDKHGKDTYMRLAGPEASPCEILKEILENASTSDSAWFVGLMDDCGTYTIVACSAEKDGTAAELYHSNADAPVIVSADGTAVAITKLEGSHLIGNDIDLFSHQLWETLPKSERIGLFVRYIDLCTGKKMDRIINRGNGI